VLITEQWHDRQACILLGESVPYIFQGEIKLDIILSNLPTLGRWLIGFFFLFFGIWNTYHWRPTHEFMVQRKIPFSLPFLFFGIAVETICALMLIFGFYVKIAALVLIPFDIVAVLIFHPFWIFTGENRRLNMVCFITNLTSTLGALILLLNTIEPSSRTIFY